MQRAHDADKPKPPADGAAPTSKPSYLPDTEDILGLIFKEKKEPLSRADKNAQRYRDRLGLSGSPPPPPR